MNNFKNLPLTILTSLLLLLPTFLPLEFWLLCRWLLQPQGFWQNLIVCGLGIYFLGGLQIMFLILGIAIQIGCWNEWEI